MLSKLERSFVVIAIVLPGAVALYLTVIFAFGLPLTLVMGGPPYEMVQLVILLAPLAWLCGFAGIIGALNTLSNDQRGVPRYSPFKLGLGIAAALFASWYFMEFHWSLSALALYMAVSGVVLMVRVRALAHLQ